MIRTVSIILLVLCCANSSAITFKFQFVNAGGASGDGRFEIATDPGVGTFPLSTLDFSLDFQLNSAGMFTEDDIINSPLSDVGVAISESGGVRHLQFIGDSGPVAQGSLELTNPAGFTLSLAPPAFGLFYLILEDGTFIDFGEYTATATATVPDDNSTGLLLVLGAGALTVIGRAARLR
jgi:hypothetical protein